MRRNQMDEREAIYRLRDHFRVHDDGRPTPYLDEAATMAYRALENQKWLRERLIEYEKNPTALGSEGLFNDLYKVCVWGWEDNYKSSPNINEIDKDMLDMMMLGKQQLLLRKYMKRGEDYE